MYSVEISEKAKKELKRLPKQTALKIFEKLEKLANDPFPVNYKQLKDFNLPNNPFHGNLYRIRVGDYRVIYAIENKRLVILVLRIAHRKEIYK